VFAVENDFSFEFGISVERIVKFSDLFSIRFGSVEKLARTTLGHDLHTSRAVLGYSTIAAQVS